MLSYIFWRRIMSAAVAVGAAVAIVMVISAIGRSGANVDCIASVLDANIPLSDLLRRDASVAGTQEEMDKNRFAEFEERLAIALRAAPMRVSEERIAKLLNDVVDAGSMVMTAVCGRGMCRVEIGFLRIEDEPASVRRVFEALREEPSVSKSEYVRVGVRDDHTGFLFLWMID